MFGSDVLDVAIGLAFLFFIASLVVTAAREVIEGVLQTRAIHLERGIRELLKDEDGSAAATQFYAHPMISSLFRGDYAPARQLTARRFKRKDTWKRLQFRSNLPAYIPARNFALALLDLSARGPVTNTTNDTAPVSFAAVRAGISDNIRDPNLQRLILVTLDTAKGDLEQARANLEKMFDSAMDRVSGWYRKETQTILLILGLIVAVAFNIDTIHVGRELYNNQALREVIVAEAQSVKERVGSDGGLPTLAALGCAGDSRTQMACAQQQMQTIGYPVGWDADPLVWTAPNITNPLTLIPNVNPAARIGWSSLPGWIMTALALALGAPFWFDVLNRLMVIRSTVKPHEKSPEESSEDSAQPKAAPVLAPPATPVTGVAVPEAAANQAAEDDPDFVPQEWMNTTDPQEGAL